ncbi:MAG: DUF421 domain-containing protein [Actinomycetia bacterium]|nr:DUF421 domain-containing protein [Actinomycetes bacterium]
MISTDLWHVSIPLAEKVIRTVLVYVGLAVLLRLGGKRNLAQLNSFDLVVMLMLGNVVQNAIIGPDNSLSGGMLGAAVLIAINAVVVRAVHLHPKLDQWFEGKSTVIIENGKVLGSAIRRLGLRAADVTAALRRQGAGEVSEVRQAVLGPGGELVVDLTDDARDATRADLRAEQEALRAQIRADVRAELEAVLSARFPGASQSAADSPP